MDGKKRGLGYLGNNSRGNKDYEKVNTTDVKSQVRRDQDDRGEAFDEFDADQNDIVNSNRFYPKVIFI